MLHDILICPETRQRVEIDVARQVARVQDSERRYPITNGIMDFLPGPADRIAKTYDAFSASYDNYLRSSGLHWKLFSLVVWGSFDDEALIQKPLASIPDDFTGVLLDVPVGTGFFTWEKYKAHPNATIVVVDCSLGMLKRARARYEENGIVNVTYIRADIGRLPIREAGVDACLSMAGFHAFPDKDLALREIARVLKPGGAFAGSFYIRGKRRLTDLFAKHVFSRKGYFTPPFFSEEEARAKFAEYFESVSVEHFKSGFFFALNRK